MAVDFKRPEYPLFRWQKKGRVISDRVVSKGLWEYDIQAEVNEEANWMDVWKKNISGINREIQEKEGEVVALGVGAEAVA